MVTFQVKFVLPAAYREGTKLTFHVNKQWKPHLQHKRCVSYYLVWRVRDLEVCVSLEVVERVEGLAIGKKMNL